MHVINVRNVCCALPTTVDLIMAAGTREDSRSGPVLVLPTPLMTETARPWERVLRSAIRDANPFFHMVESIWMLAGREDAATLNHYVKDFGTRYAEPQLGTLLPENDGRIHDAYGRRWRMAFNFDQLDVVVQRFIENENDRQCVITMWDPSMDVHNDLCGPWLTRPCNTHIYLRLHDAHLDMTVCCRSNDMIWGGHGANAVHFSVLHEYLAARADAIMGKMYQLSNNAHLYVAELDRIAARRKKQGSGGLEHDHYSSGEVEAAPMFTEPAAIDEDIMVAMHWHNNTESELPEFANNWFSTTFVPAVLAHRIYRSRDMDMAIKIAGTIKSSDWRFACVEWLQRRVK